MVVQRGTLFTPVFHFVLASGQACPPVGTPYKRKNLTKQMLGLPRASLYAVFTGMVSGYPAGARITGEMVRSGVLLSPMEAVRTLPYTMCCSPTFLVGNRVYGAPAGAGACLVACAVALWRRHIVRAVLQDMVWMFKPRLPSFQQPYFPRGEP